MKNIYFLIVILLPLTLLNNQFEKENNKLLFKATENIRSGKKVENSKRIEEQYKKNIDLDIQHQLDNLSQDKKILLGNFDHNYRKLKEKLELIKSSCNGQLKLISEQLNLKQSFWNFQQEDFLFTVLGLKPVSVVDEGDNIKWCNFDKIYNNINQKYNNGN